MEVETKKLKEHPFNLETFKDTQGYDFDALKEDIRKNGIKTELHITPDYVVLCGHQRLKAAKELGLKTIPYKIVSGLKTEEQEKEYIIKDNLLRRHLTTEQRMLLFAELSRLYEVGRGGDRKSEKIKEAKSASLIPKEGFRGNQYERGKEAKSASSLQKESVLEKTAREVGVSPRTIDNARRYAREIENNPALKALPYKEAIKEIKGVPEAPMTETQPAIPEAPKVRIRYNKAEDILTIKEKEGNGRVQKFYNFIVLFDGNTIVGIQIRDVSKFMKEHIG